MEQAYDVESSEVCLYVAVARQLPLLADDAQGPGISDNGSG